MTAPITRSAIPATQNTAPVLEYRGLYTHDAHKNPRNRKWHDGILRLHTFNKRVMLYDTAGGLIGDTHLKEEGRLLEEGEELRLNRGTLVEVGEQLVETQTDLTELLKKRSSGGGGSGSPARGDADAALAQRQQHTPQGLSGRLNLQTPSRTGGLQAVQPKHKSLNALLGPRRGLHGKAVLPTKSPYQVRQDDKENTDADGRLEKRLKRDHSSPLPTKKRSIASKPQDLPLWAEIGDSGSQPAPGGTDIVDISSDDTRSDPRSDVTMLPAYIACPNPPRFVSLQRLPPKSPSSRQVTPLKELSESNHAPRQRIPMTMNRPEVELPPKTLPDQQTTAIVPEAKVVRCSHPRPVDASHPRPPNLIEEQGPRKTLGSLVKPADETVSKEPVVKNPLRIIKAAPRRMLLCGTQEPILKSRMALELEDVPRASGSRERTEARKNPENARPRLSGTSKRARKKPTVFDVDSDLSDAQSNGAGAVAQDIATAANASRKTEAKQPTSQHAVANDRKRNIQRVKSAHIAENSAEDSESASELMARSRCTRDGLKDSAYRDSLAPLAKQTLKASTKPEAISKPTPVVGVEASTALATVRSSLTKRKSLSTTDAGNDAASKGTVRSSLTKRKSLSTTDVGNDAASRGTKAFKGSTHSTKKEAAGEIDGPWSEEAFDLFGRRPPTSVAVVEESTRPSEVIAS